MLGNGDDRCDDREAKEMCKKKKKKKRKRKKGTDDKEDDSIGDDNDCMLQVSETYTEGDQQPTSPHSHLHFRRDRVRVRAGGTDGGPARHQV